MLLETTLTCRVPSAHDDPPIGRVVLDLVNDLSQLIHTLTGIIVLARLVRRAEMPPLESVHWTQIPHPPMREPDPIEVLPRPISFPDIDTLVAQNLAIRMTGDKPKKLFDDAPRKDPLCRQKRQSVVGEREPKRRGCEHGDSSCTCAIGTMLAVLNDMSDQVEVLVLLVAGVGGKRREVRRFESLARRGRGDARRTAAQSIGDDAVEERKSYQISSKRSS